MHVRLQKQCENGAANRFKSFRSKPSQGNTQMLFAVKATNPAKGTVLAQISYIE